MNLQRLCLKGHSVCNAPMLRRRGKSIWTVATNGHALLAVRGKHSDHIGETLNVRAIFRATAFHPEGWLEPIVVPWAELRDFVRTRYVSNGLDSEPVSIHRVTVNAALLRRFAYGLKAETVTVRGTRDTTRDFGAKALRIDAKDWSVLVMAILQKPVAEFHIVDALGEKS